MKIYTCAFALLLSGCVGSWVSSPDATGEGAVLSDSATPTAVPAIEPAYAVDDGGCGAVVYRSADLAERIAGTTP